MRRQKFLCIEILGKVLKECQTDKEAKENSSNSLKFKLSVKNCYNSIVFYTLTTFLLQYNAKLTFN